MKFAKNIAACLLAGLWLLAFGLSAGASSSGTSSDEWYVTFTRNKKMETNFKSSDIAKLVSGMQPGDSSTLSIKLKNENNRATNWYMKNETITSLEDDTVAEGGAYTYRLTYTNKAGKVNILYDSETVGGEKNNTNSEGLHEATDSLKDFFYLDTLQSGDSGKVDLQVKLDGETQNNLYQNTMADVQFNFAVDEVNDDTTSRQVVKTGDETNLLPLYGAMAVSGVLLLIIACYSVKKGRQGEKEGGRHEK